MKKCRECNLHKAQIKKLANLNTKKTGLLRHQVIMLKKIRNMLDYMIEHPYGRDTGNKSLKHKRDMRGKTSKLNGRPLLNKR